MITVLAPTGQPAAGTTTDGESLRLYRLRYRSSASIWGFAIYRASHDDYEPSTPPTGATAGSPEEALDNLRPLPRWTPPPESHPRRTNSEKH